MKVEIWSDVVCPWCYIGKRRFEAALGRFAHLDDLSFERHVSGIERNAWSLGNGSKGATGQREVNGAFERRVTCGQKPL